MSRIANRPVSAADAAPASAPDAMTEHLDSPPALMEAALRGGTRLTRRWRHGELHDTLPAMSGHVIMTFYGASQEASWRQGARRLAGRTRPGAVTVIPEGQDGRWDIEAPIEVSHVYLPDERLQSLAEVAGKGQRIELVSRICFDDAAGARILELLGHEAGTGDPASSLFVEQAVELLCMQLVRAHSSLGARERQVPRKGLADWQVRKVTAFMREFLDREILLDELAGLVNLSRFHFCTAFRQATGQTPHEWLTALRIGRSRQLLANPEMPITGIALAVGYQTPSSFSASFRKVTGMSPSAFRRSL
ncbi:AraC family transcriptional regulator [Azospirillum sp. SYSU D00513]|uniref:AraC family transcriptional regulator n=1 Tax=Azospirillum sp. SYSU D00513 TaxID=2812561 RepID=UPI001A959AE0|nr:AraC family transcriptional regulator [Azospirillum sp. SYSU D00513]